MDDKFSPPTQEDIGHLAKQCVFVDSLIDEHYGAKLDESVSDLAQLQRILDDRILDATQTWELQALGVVFGRVLVNNVADLDWWIVDDEYGRDPTVRYGRTSIQLNVLTMISKRVEDGEQVDVVNLYHGIIENLEEVKTEISAE